MKTVYFDKKTNKSIIFSCKTDLLKHIGRKSTTVYKWAKEGIKETNDFILLFDCFEQKSKNMKGNPDSLKKDQY